METKPTTNGDKMSITRHQAIQRLFRLRYASAASDLDHPIESDLCGSPEQGWSWTRKSDFTNFHVNPTGSVDVW